jgi:hypothetical protein
MKKLIGIILVITLLSQSVYAASCPAPVTLLNEGDKAPCFGYLFTKEKEDELYKVNENYKLLTQEDTLKDKKINDLQTEITNLNSSLTLSQQQSQLWQDKSISITDKYTQLEDSRGKRDLMFAGAGILLMLISAIAYGQIAKH